MASPTDPTALTQTFTHRIGSYVYTIKWTSLGPENSEGPSVIFVHGTPWSSRTWSPFALALSTRYTVYLYDNPGFGQSPWRTSLDDAGRADDDVHNASSELDASLAGQAEAFAALYTHWGFRDDDDDKPHVIAHDNAGMFTIRANLLHGCAYASLCLVDVVAVGPFGSPFFDLVAENRHVFCGIPASMFEGFVRAYVSSAAFKSLSRETQNMLVEPWLEGRSQGQEAFVRQMIQAYQRHTELEERYGEIGDRIPVKVIWGKEDAWIPVERAEKLTKVIKAKEMVLVEEAGHLIHYDQPVRLAVEVATWLSQVAK
jgi:pimeloyl-ACP methyl ester carboxylesterase